MSSLTDSKVLHILRSMFASRLSSIHERQYNRRGRNLLQVGTDGAEGTAIIALFSNKHDHHFLHWRDRAWKISLGMKLDAFAGHFFSQATEPEFERNLIGHESCPTLNIYPIATPVPSHCLPACGVAWQLVRSGSAGIIYCSLGDGSTRQGEFLESVAFAIEKQLPILFTIVDNGFAISTKTAGLKATDLGLIPNNILTTVRAHQPIEMLRLTEHVTRGVRNGGGPHVLVVECPRLCSHTSNDDQSSYRSASEVSQDEEERDPIPAFEQWCRDGQHLNDEDIEAAKKDAESMVEAVYANAATDENPVQEELVQTSLATQMQMPENNRQFTNELPYFERIRDAVNGALRHLLKNTSNAVLFGQDVEDPLGGVFRLTSGLSTEFPGQVINAPLAEATILGVTCGIAMTGELAIAELQFIDFISPGWNQLVTNLSTLHWRTNGRWKAPVVIYAPVDGYCPGEGIWHSQVNASQFARNEHLRVLMPSNPIDTWSAFQFAKESVHPTLILLPKALLWKRFEKSETIGLVQKQPEFEKVRFCTRGKDCTVVAWGNGVAQSMEAMSLLSNVEIELIDVYSLNPIELASIEESAKKTRHVVIVDVEHEGASIGNFIASKLYREIPGVSIRVQHRSQQYLGCSPQSEERGLIWANDIRDAVVNLLNQGG